MIELLLFLMLVVFIGLFLDIEKEKLHIINFQGIPLEITTKNNRPVLHYYDENIREDVRKAWKTHLKNIGEMSKAERSLDTRAYRRKCQMEQFQKLEDFLKEGKKDKEAGEKDKEASV